MKLELLSLSCHDACVARLDDPMHTGKTTNVSILSWNPAIFIFKAILSKA
jgi:hypothetical protein